MFKYESYGKNPFKLAIIGATHGDESLGVKVIEELKKKKIEDITYIIANPMAQERNVRYIEKDLNRCFLDEILESENNNLYEEVLAKELNNFLKKFNNIIDLHSTYFDVPGYFIIDNIKKLELPILSGASIINKVYVLGGLKGALISKYNNAIAIEIGHNNSRNNVNIIVNTLLEIISNLDKKTSFSKEVFKGKGAILKESIFSLKKGIEDFSIIKKGEQIGFKKDGKPIFAKEDTGILWTNFKDDEILCFKCEKI